MASIARNTAFLSVAKMLSVAIYALFGLLLPRFVSTETNGVYSLISNLLFFGSMAASFGIPLIIVRDVAQDRSRAAAIYAGSRLAMGGGAVLAGMLLVLYLFLEMSVQGRYDPMRVHLGLMAAAILFCDAIGTVGESIFQAWEEMVVPAVVEAATGLVRAGGGILVLTLVTPPPPPGGVAAAPPEFGRSSLYWLYGLFLSASFARAVVVPRLARRRFLPGPLPAAGFQEAWHLLVRSFHIALFRMLRMVRNRIDVQLLGLCLAPVAGMALQDTVDTARGLYIQAYRVVIVFHTLTLAFNTAIFPRMARLAREHGGTEELRRQFFRTVRYQAWWATPLAGVTFFYAAHIAGWFGPQYRDGVAGLGSTTAVLQILVFSIFLDTVGGPVGMVLFGAGTMDRLLPRLGGILAGASVLLNVLLIPRYGIVGAAFASLGASLVEFVGKLWLIRRFVGRPGDMVPAVVPYLAVTLLLLAVLARTPLAHRPILGGLAVAAVWLPLSIVLGLADPAIRQRLGRVLPGRS